MKPFSIFLVLIISAALLSACSGLAGSPAPAITTIAPQSQTPASEPISEQTPAAIIVHTYRVVNTYPHDKGAFTQGLFFEDEFLYEGTGLEGQSSLRKVELETGKVLQIRRLPPGHFGEGITLFDDTIIQLTWKSMIGFVFDKNSFEPLHEFYYPGEGWGITSDGKRLIMSDGTSVLRFLDPNTFQDIGRLEVSDNDGPVAGLNELEYIQGEIYANVWKTDRIAIISLQTGRITGWIDLKGLLSRDDYGSGPIDVLNGIAYDSKVGKVFVTGKWWPKLFEIEIIPSRW